MSTVLSKAQRYRERAIECENLAAMAIEEETRQHYRAIAASYTTMAEAELKLDAESQKIKGGQFY